MFYNVPAILSTPILSAALHPRSPNIRSFMPGRIQPGIMQYLLIVDDSPIFIERLLGMLEGMLLPEQIGNTGNFAQALDHIARHPPDILLLDVNLPDKSGIELLRVVRDRYPAVVVIMISNQSTDSYRTVCARLGATAFLDKSAEFERIPALIAAFLDPNM
jgi:DNA-binding NarL/FixJ family response regulator